MTERKPLKITAELSLATVPISMARRRAGSEPLGGASGTGFLWERDGQLSLITNRHNVTGWDTVNNRALSPNGFAPDILVAYVAIADELNGGRAVTWQTIEIDLFSKSGEPQWLEHPRYGGAVDVVAVPCALDCNQLATSPFNRQRDLLAFDPSVGTDVFVLGYPLGLSGGLGLPIWKRGSIASEPDFDLGGLPMFYIDTATREGMSGSPVIAVNRGLTRLRDTEATGPVSPFDLVGTAMTFIGVYSGRVGTDQMGVQLGVVWKAGVVDDIVSHGKPGTLPYG